MRKLRDLTGKKFNRLTVVERADGTDLWRCKCDCGNETITKGSRLLNQTTKSCGCLINEHRNKMKRIWRL